MGLAYENLDDATRRFMVEEIDMDVASGKIYISSFLNAEGCDRWPDMLRDAARVGTDDQLANLIRSDRCLNHQYERRKPKGGFTMAAVPVTAHQTMGEGEFGRYYARGLCRRAIEEGIPRLEVYRARSLQTFEKRRGLNPPWDCRRVRTPA